MSSEFHFDGRNMMGSEWLEPASTPSPEGPLSHARNLRIDWPTAKRAIRVGGAAAGAVLLSGCTTQGPPERFLYTQYNEAMAGENFQHAKETDKAVKTAKAKATDQALNVKRTQQAPDPNDLERVSNSCTLVTGNPKLDTFEEITTGLDLSGADLYECPQPGAYVSQCDHLDTLEAQSKIGKGNYLCTKPKTNSFQPGRSPFASGRSKPLAQSFGGVLYRR